MKKSLLLIALSVFTGSAFAAAGDSTLSVDYFQTKSQGLKKIADEASSAMHTLNTGAVNAYNHDDDKVRFSPEGYNDPKGLAVRYRYEFTDSFGLIGSLSYAKNSSYNTLSMANTSTQQGYDFNTRVKGDYFSALVGPAVRINDYVSLYGMAGLAHKSVDYSLSGTATDTSGATVTIADERNSQSKTSLAYSVGAQFNVYQGLTIDAAYEGSNGGDWKTNGLSIGLGYKF